MPTDIKNAIYKTTGQQGQIEYKVLPDYNVDQASGTRVTNPQELTDYISQLQSMGTYVPGSRTGPQFDTQQVLRDTQEALSRYNSTAGQTIALAGVQNPLNPSETLNNIEPSRLQDIQNTANQVQSGQMINIGTAAQPRYVPAGSAGAVAAQGGSFAEQLKTPTATAPGVVPIDPDAIPKRFEQAFNATKEQDYQTPSDAVGANDMFKNFLTEPQGPTAAENFVSQDPYLNSTIQAYQQYMSQQNQRTSLVEEYQSLLKTSGIEAIDMELINMKK